MYRLFLLLMLYCPLVSSQNLDYYGGGKTQGITVTASDEYHNPRWQTRASAENTVNANGLLAPYFDAYRFLVQTSLGFEETHVDEVLSLGYEAWIEDQFQKPATWLLPKTKAIYQITVDSMIAAGFGDLVARRPRYDHFSYAWWQVNMTNDDLLRHRMATALSEIFVISSFSDLNAYGDGVASYYDLLAKHAFGNFRDLLYDVALHPCMGYYLSHLNNPKTDLDGGIYPDENFARELMQLFSIGLVKLNNNGTPYLENGREVPTYNNNDITEFAKVFTGLGIGDIEPELTNPDLSYDDTARFGMRIYNADMTVPMRMYEWDNPDTQDDDEDQHEPGPKQLLDGFVLDGSQSGLEEIDAAIGHLFDHPNVGPFIARRLIQRLVKSNPSPSYIDRVATVFNSGDGVYSGRGNMKAVILAILMDPEARDAEFQDHDENSMLREPMIRYTHFVRAIEVSNPNGYIWRNYGGFQEEMKQAIFASPSVFNFFSPESVPFGEIQEAGLVAPEFKLHDASTSIASINAAHSWAYFYIMAFETKSMKNSKVTWNIDHLLSIANESETYINWLDKHILGGRMTDRTRKILRTAINGLNPTKSDFLEKRVRMGMYLTLISPDYAIIR